MIECDIEPPEFVGIYHKDNAPAGKVADEMQKALGLESEGSAEHNTWECAFTHLLERIDDAGVMLTVSVIVRGNIRHNLDPDEFQ